MEEISLVALDDIALLGVLTARQLQTDCPDVPMAAVRLSRVVSDQPGHSKILASITLDAMTTLVVRTLDWQSHRPKDEVLKQKAADIVESISSIWNARADMCSLLAAVTAAARRHVDRAIELGVRYLLESIQFEDVAAGSTRCPPVRIDLRVLDASSEREPRMMYIWHPHELEGSFANLEQSRLLVGRGDPASA